MSNIILRIIAESLISVKDITLPLQKEDAFITKTFVNLHVRHYYISRSVKSVLEGFIVSQLHKDSYGCNKYIPILRFNDI